MFNLFKKKDRAARVIDKIWMTGSAKLRSLADEGKNNQNIAGVFWFAESLLQAEHFLATEMAEPILLVMARETSGIHLAGKTIILAEHYPLREKETAFFNELHLEEVQVWSALDEPLFRQFGGEKIIAMMKQMGMKEDRPVTHSMISNAIRNAQEKIAKKVLLEQTASSQEEWLRKNAIDKEQ